MQALLLKDVITKLNNFTLGPINLEIEEFGYYVIIGPNGSGKTTLLKTILGFYRPVSGRIILYGKDITDLPIEKRNIGYVTQGYSLFNNMDVKSNLEYGLKARKFNKNEIKKRVENITEMLNIGNLLNKRPRELSGGQQQLISIARALVTNPKILLLDEPLSNLDPEVKNNLRSILRKIAKLKTTTIIHVTHSIDDAFELSSNLVFIYKGKIVEMGNPIDMIYNPRTKELAEYLGYTNTIELNYTKNVNENLVNNYLEIKREDFDDEKIFAVFKPEDIKICMEKCCENSLEGKIVDLRLTNNGFLYSIRVNDGITLNALNKDIFKEGTTVNVCIDKEKVRIVKTAEAGNLNILH